VLEPIELNHHIPGNLVPHLHVHIQAQRGTAANQQRADRRITKHVMPGLGADPLYESARIGTTSASAKTGPTSNPKRR
jgi:hypothetical protein